MIDETSGTEKFQPKHHESDLDDRERMTERALSAIGKLGGLPPSKNVEHSPIKSTQSCWRDRRSRRLH
jgi:hypothetical protein